MASYDSDSDGGEKDFTETDVLLGYASSDAGNETVSRLGGRPDWFTPNKPPSASLARCKICKDIMVLLLQLNGELPDRFPGHERRLYVFSCKKKSCRRKVGAVRAVRGVRVDPGAVGAAAAAAAAAAAMKNKDVEERQKKAAAAAPKPATSTGLGEALFGVKPAGGGGSGPANPFASSANPFSSKPPSQASSSAAANPFSSASKPSPKEEEEQSRPAEKQQQPAPSLSPSSSDALPATFAEKLALNNPQVPSGPPPPSEPWPPEADQPAPYPVSWIADAEYETLDPTPLPSVPATVTTMDVDDHPSGGGSSSSGGKEDKEVFESTMDAAFQKFADRVGQNPEQVIRYEFGGVPLLYSRDDVVGRALFSATGAGAGTGAEKKVVVAVSSGPGGGGGGGMPPCGNCGAGRVFEVQLTPNAIAELESEEDGLDGMDWGTIIVGVCERNCQERGVKEGEAGYVEEWAGVQWEELTMKR